MKSWMEITNQIIHSRIEIEAGEDLCYGLLTFNAVGESQTIEFESVEDFLSMLVSVRLLSYTFVERKNENG